MLFNTDKISINLIKMIRLYFGKNVSSFYQFDNPDNGDIFIQCIVYRSYQVQFTIGDIQKGGVLNLGVSLGNGFIGLSFLTSEEEELAISCNEQSIIHNLKILDKYLQWRMTDSQKASFDLL